MVGFFKKKVSCHLILISVIAILACLLAFLLGRHRGFNLADEGFLWYGVERVLRGEVPIRDFSSYDPGRYYWAAFWLWLSGTQGAVAVRTATMMFFASAVVLAARAVWLQSSDRTTVRYLLAMVAVAWFLVWMIPWWKSYDAAISILLVLSLGHALAQPQPKRLFLHGLVVGLAAVFGRNHGLYGLVACFLSIPFVFRPIGRPSRLRVTAAWAAGILIGYMPMLGWLVFDHQFHVMFWDGIRFILFEYKGTNLPLPVPWPWRVSFAQDFWMVAWQLAIGLLFFALPLFCIVGIAVVSIRHARRSSIPPLFLACVLTAIPYTNVAFSRADMAHLAQAIYPGMIGFLVWPASRNDRVRWRLAIIAVLTILSLLAALPMHPGFMSRLQGNWRVADIGGEHLVVDAATARSVKAIQTLSSRHGVPPATMVTAPVWPGAMAMLHARSAAWEIYPLVPRNESFQRQEIARVADARPGLIFILDIAVDGRPELRYSATHPLIWQYVHDHYLELPPDRDLPGVSTFVPRVQSTNGNR
ncbi:hypothetical protein [Rhodanobacter thiooxydans]|uniref:hypothetical protein n=1 Tax=Rhodanobacter thiooxydans TaxID=416169 RepID=UPI000260D620|nr:hypothetical protein [Rhodanobacter thiooxydans]EIL98451.1 hypothetical protein UUA_11793 [Rhodanobacter thiooxydans LCS2]